MNAHNHSPVLQEPGFVIATTDDSSPPPVTEGQTFHHIKNFAGALPSPHARTDARTLRSVKRTHDCRVVSEWLGRHCGRSADGAVVSVKDFCCQAGPTSPGNPNLNPKP